MKTAFLALEKQIQAIVDISTIPEAEALVARLKEISFAEQVTLYEGGEGKPSVISIDFDRHLGHSEPFVAEIKTVLAVHFGEQAEVVDIEQICSYGTLLELVPAA